MKQFVRKLFYTVTSKETKWDYVWDGKQYNWKKLRLSVKRREMMKKLFVLVTIMFFVPSLCLAAPFVICDPYPPESIQPDNFKVAMDGGAVVNSAPQAVADSVRLHYDVDSVSVGQHHMTVQACKTYPTDVWNNGGEICTSIVPFDFSRPATKTAPGGLVNIRLTNE